MTNLLRQLKKRRIDLKLRQCDMLLIAGISRQQYQRLESKGNPRLDTLELLAKGLACELMLIPNEKLAEVQAILSGTTDQANPQLSDKLVDNPWKDLLKDSE